jgi:hypothetical protein
MTTTLFVFSLVLTATGYLALGLFIERAKHARKLRVICELMQVTANDRRRELEVRLQKPSLYVDEVKH